MMLLFSYLLFLTTVKTLVKSHVASAEHAPVGDEDLLAVDDKVLTTELVVSWRCCTCQWWWCRVSHVECTRHACIKVEVVVHDGGIPRPWGRLWLV